MSSSFQTETERLEGGRARDCKVEPCPSGVITVGKQGWNCLGGDPMAPMLAGARGGVRGFPHKGADRGLFKWLVFKHEKSPSSSSMAVSSSGSYSLAEIDFNRPSLNRKWMFFCGKVSSCSMGHGIQLKEDELLGLTNWPWLPPNSSRWHLISCVNWATCLTSLDLHFLKM